MGHIVFNNQNECISILWIWLCYKWGVAIKLSCITIIYSGCSQKIFLIAFSLKPTSIGEIAAVRIGKGIFGQSSVMRARPTKWSDRAVAGRAHYADLSVAGASSPWTWTNRTNFTVHYGSLLLQSSLCAWCHLLHEVFPFCSSPSCKREARLWSKSASASF